MNIDKKIIIIGIFVLFIIGIILGKTAEYYSNDYCEDVEQQYSACVYGCDLSNIPLNKYEQCTMFCEQRYDILEEQNQCTWFHKLLR